MIFLPARLWAACRRLHAIALAALPAGALLVACGGSGGGGMAASPAPVLVKSESESTPSGPRDCSVTLEGDSIMYGAYGINMRLDEPPAAMLKRMRPAYTVVDNAVPGTAAIQREPGFVATPVATRFVVLEHGINDGQLGYPYEGPLRSMVAHARAQGRTPVITGLTRQPRPVRGRDFYDGVARQVASDTGTLFADWGSVAFTPGEMADAVHPGPVYSERLVARLVSLLDKAAPECVR